MWGQVFVVCRFHIAHSIIPTRVGTSKYLSLKTYLFQDHPHACGDKFCLAYNLQVAAGSSPRVWGQVIDELGELEIEGIIPTRVGTSD